MAMPGVKKRARPTSSLGMACTLTPRDWRDGTLDGALLMNGRVCGCMLRRSGLRALMVLHGRPILGAHKEGATLLTPSPAHWRCNAAILLQGYTPLRLIDWLRLGQPVPVTFSRESPVQAMGRL